MRIDLPLLKFQDDLKIKKEDGFTFIFDTIRKKYLKLAPEEMVRQLLIQWMVQEHQVNSNRIAVERGITVNGMYKRCDVLVYDFNLRPFLLVECKAPQVKITQKTFEQIARYNIPLKVPYLLVSNGQDNYCCKIDFPTNSFEFLDKIPSYLNNS